jgi:S-adenosylmethionine hydrolase
MKMVVLLTDFGWAGPYVGQMKVALAAHAPHQPIIDLIHDLPRFNVRAAAHLLPAYTATLPLDSVVLVVVDPGVGSSSREPVMVEVEGRWYVGPGNGVFERLCASASEYRYWRITWRPTHLSASFHGRDLFAPVAAMLASGTPPELLGERAEWHSQGWTEELAEVIYIDHYGNCVTGLNGERHNSLKQLTVSGRAVGRARTFADVQSGEPLFYTNSSELLEIAVNQGRADTLLGLQIGSELTLPEEA